MKVDFCLIGLTLLFSSIYMSIENRDTDHFKKFYNLLTSEQKSKYESIVKERLMIYLGGILLGMFISYNYYQRKKNTKHILCKSLTIHYLISLGFYYFFPKSPLMLYSLNSKDQVEAWADIYSEMKHRWIKSLLIGIFAYFFLVFAFIDQ